MSSAGALASRASAAGAAERQLRNVVAAVDPDWKDGARRSFDQRYLDQVLADAGRLKKELSELSGDLAKAAAMAEV